MLGVNFVHSNKLVKTAIPLVRESAGGDGLGCILLTDRFVIRLYSILLYAACCVLLVHGLDQTHDSCMIYLDTLVLIFCSQRRMTFYYSSEG